MAARTGSTEKRLAAAHRCHEDAIAANLEGRPRLAVRLAQRALAHLEKVPGRPSTETARILLTMSRASLAAGESEQATAFGQRAMHLTRRATTDPEHAQLRIHARLQVARATRTQGRLDEAESRLLSTLRLAREVLPRGDSTIGLLFNELGVVYKYKGEFAKASTAYRRALPMLKRSFGPQSLEVAAVYHNLGGLAHARGDYRAAIRPAQRSVDLQERLVGPRHPSHAASAAALAAILDVAGRREEAEVLYRRSIAVLERSLGTHHPEVAFQLANFGGLLHRRGRHERAATVYRRALAIERRCAAPVPLTRALILNNLAALHHDGGAFRHALPLSAEALRIFRAVLGPHHPSTTASAANHRALLAAMAATAHGDRGGRRRRVASRAGLER